jgi:hypothetical protein
VEHYLLRRDGCPCRTRILRNEDVLTFVLSDSSSLVFGGIERDPMSTKGFVVAPNCIDSVLAVCSNPERGHTWLSEVDVGGMSEVVARTGTKLESLVIEEVNDETLQGTGMFVKDSIVGRLEDGSIVGVPTVGVEADFDVNVIGLEQVGGGAFTGCDYRVSDRNE